MFYPLFTLMAFFGLTAAQASKDPKVPMPCSFGGFVVAPVPGPPCPSGLTCVLSSFGFPAADQPRVGTCRRLSSPLPLCSVSVCSANGAGSLCRAFSSQESPPSLVGTCRAWATRIDTPALNCFIPCSAECITPKLLASDGSLFCNLCQLQVASCISDFELFGPVKGMVVDKCAPPITPFNAAQCCRDEGIGCLPEGSLCSTAGSQVPPVPCKAGLMCAIFFSGLPAADVPNIGVCLPEPRTMSLCTVDYCARYGGAAVCKSPFPGSNDFITCKTWARYRGSKSGPNCAFVCSEKCLPLRKRPVASNGRRFCNECSLRRASCENDFMFFGPIYNKV